MFCGAAAGYLSVPKGSCFVALGILYLWLQVGPQEPFGPKYIVYTHRDPSLTVARGNLHTMAVLL